MRKLSDEKEKISSCSKCGLCQSVCPIYKVSKNDCTVSRGHFIMLSGLIKNELKMSGTINRYLDSCLKCGACSKFCPSGINVVDILCLAKAEYFKNHKLEKFKSFIQKTIVFNLIVKILGLGKKQIKSKKFDKKVLYFGGCKNRISGNKAVIKILNNCGIEVIIPDFDCCGIPFLVRGDIETFKDKMDSFYNKVRELGVTDIVTTCASCENSLKSYPRWGGNGDLRIKNIFEYIRENNLKLKLKKNKKVTFHKPCNLTNYEDVSWILNNTENLDYTEMEHFDECCGLNGITKFNEYKIMLKLFLSKRKSIIKTNTHLVLTSCLGCEFALKLISLFNYKVQDLTEFLSDNISD